MLNSPRLGLTIWVIILLARKIWRSQNIIFINFIAWNIKYVPTFKFFMNIWTFIYSYNIKAKITVSIFYHRHQLLSGPIFVRQVIIYKQYFAKIRTSNWRTGNTQSKICRTMWLFNSTNLLLSIYSL